MSNIEQSISGLAIEIDSLVPLPNNPRKGSIEAIMASYKEFGQVKPIVVTPNGDGTFTVIAGNHQVEAAKRLGWKEIAAVKYDVDSGKAVAFALADNRTNELGHTDPELLNDIIVDVVEEYSVLLEGLGWDEFELAALDEQAIRLDNSHESGYIPPVIISDPQELRQVPPVTAGSTYEVEATEEGNRIVPKGEVDSKSVAATGSTTIGASGSTKAVVQYTLVFDDAEQQRHWYDFVRWIRSSPVYEGSTTAERLMNFIDAHADF